MKSNLLKFASLLLAPSFVLEVFAAFPQTTLAQERQQFTALRRIDRPEAMGAKAKPPTLALVPGYGLNISFIPTGETIEKIWLDNPQYATLDVDGCLEDLPRSRQCDRPGAQIVHLRRIRDLRFPGLYPTTSTLLTVITNSGQQRNVYTFRLIKGQGNPNYITVEVVPTSSYSNNITLSNNISQNNSSIGYNTIATGVQVALAQGILQPRSRLWYRIDSFLLRLKAGTPLQTAATLSGLSDKVVLRLHNLSISNGVNSRPQVAPTTVPNYQNSRYPTPGISRGAD